MWRSLCPEVIFFIGWIWLKSAFALELSKICLVLSYRLSCFILCFPSTSDCSFVYQSVFLIHLVKFAMFVSRLQCPSFPPRNSYSYAMAKWWTTSSALPIWETRTTSRRKCWNGASPRSRLSNTTGTWWRGRRTAWPNRPPKPKKCWRSRWEGPRRISEDLMTVILPMRMTGDGMWERFMSVRWRKSSSLPQSSLDSQKTVGLCLSLPLLCYISRERKKLFHDME